MSNLTSISSSKDGNLSLSLPLNIASSQQLTSSSSSSESPMQTQQLHPPIMRGHRHRRSAAISGDFDLNSLLPPISSMNNQFQFQSPASHNQSLSKSLPCSPVKAHIKLSSINPILNGCHNDNNNHKHNHNHTNSHKNNNNNTNTTHNFIDIDNDNDIDNNTTTTTTISNNDNDNDNDNYKFNSNYDDMDSLTDPNTTPPSFENNSLMLNSPFKKSTANANTNTHTNTNTNTNSNTVSSTPIKLFITDETKFNNNNNIPEALINLDDIINKSNNLSLSSPSLPLPVLSLNKRQRHYSTPESDFIHYPKHSLMCSPKKTEVVIAEEIMEEDNFNINTPSSGNNLNSDSDDDTNSCYDNILSRENLNSNLNSHSNSHNNLDLENLLLSKDSNSSLNSLPMKSVNNNLIVSDNGSSNSLSSNNSNNNFNTINNLNMNNTSAVSKNNPFSSVNTSSISSLRGKVRYQSYYNNKLIPSSPISSKTMKSPLIKNYLNSSINRSSSKSPIKKLNLKNSSNNINLNKPFQYESKEYELPKNFHREFNSHSLNSNSLSGSLTNDDNIETNDNAIYNNHNNNSNADSDNNENNDNNNNIIINSTVSLPSNNNLKHNYFSSNSTSSSSLEKNPNNNDKSIMSTNSNKNDNDSLSHNISLPKNPSNLSHQRTGSLFSVLSKKLSHHRRRSSIFSNKSSFVQDITPHSNSLPNSKSIIEKTTDELMGLQNDSTLINLDDNGEITITPEVLGEPGPMIEVNENDLNSIINTTNPSTKIDKQSKKKNIHHRKSLFSWIVKSKKTQTHN